MVADGSTEKSKNEGGGSSNDANANVDALYDSQNLSCPLGVSLVAAVGTICVDVVSLQRRSIYVRLVLSSRNF